MKEKILNYILNKKKLSNISIFLFTFFIIYIIFLFVTKHPINLINFYIITFFSHLFFLVIIPLEGVFYVQIKNAILNPYIFLITLSVVATIAYYANYKIGQNIPKQAFITYLGKTKFEKYNKKYDKYGNLLLFIAASTPFLPGPIFSLLSGFFNEDLKKTLTISFIGLLLKWLTFYILFTYSIRIF